MAKSKSKRLPHVGELELALLEHLWTVDEADVLTAHRAVGRPRDITPNTVGSALERLHRKGLLTRAKVSHAYRYRARLSREAFTAQRMLDALGDTRKLADAGLLAAFVELVADEDEASLDRLEALIAEKRSSRGNP